MKLPPQAQLSDAKYREILELLQRLRVDLSGIEESFVRGSGHGGQKINKTSSAVHLKHLPSGIEVKFQKFRQRPMNRILALRELLLKLDPEARDSKAEKVRKQKKRRQRRSSSDSSDVRFL